MHPGGADNIVRDGAFGGRGDLGNIIGNPLETTYFLSRLIFGDSARTVQGSARPSRRQVRCGGPCSASNRHANSPSIIAVAPQTR